MTQRQPICDIGSDCGGCPECGGPPAPNDPGYSTLVRFRKTALVSQA